MLELNCAFGTVWTWSQFTTQSRGSPSKVDNATSLGIPRMFVVSGATVTSPRLGMIESRVSISTGLRLSGKLNRYQRISPLRISRRPMRRRPMRDQILEYRILAD